LKSRLRKEQKQNSTKATGHAVFLDAAVRRLSWGHFSHVRAWW